ncbi:hypothetical protein V3C99_005745 [Haemonchus contortus]
MLHILTPHLPPTNAESGMILRSAPMRRLQKSEPTYLTGPPRLLLALYTDDVQARDQLDSVVTLHTRTTGHAIDGHSSPELSFDTEMDKLSLTLPLHLPPG